MVPPSTDSYNLLPILPQVLYCILTKPCYINSRGVKMKKLVLILGVFAVIAGSVAAYFAYNKPKIILPKPIEQGFKNPLFYRPLEAYGRTSWHTFLTPYSITLTPPLMNCCILGSREAVITWLSLISVIINMTRI